MATELQLIVNGLDRVVAVEEPASLAMVLAALELKPDRIAVEHNGRIARRTTWAETPVQAKDRLEIVHFVGGGSQASYRICVIGRKPLRPQAPEVAM